LPRQRDKHCYFKKGTWYDNEYCDNQDKWLDPHKYLSFFKSLSIKENEHLFFDNHGFDNQILFELFEPYFENNIIYGPVKIIAKFNNGPYETHVSYSKLDTPNGITGIRLFSIGSHISYGGTKFKISKIKNGYIEIESKPFISNARHTQWD